MYPPFVNRVLKKIFAFLRRRKKASFCSREGLGCVRYFIKFFTSPSFFSEYG